jgi:hypothetical protein
MKMILVAAAGTVALAALGGGAAAAKPDKTKPDKYWYLRSDCDRKLASAHKSRDFYKRLDECNRHLADYRLHQRRDAIKEWQKREKDWRKVHKADAKHRYDWRH